MKNTPRRMKLGDTVRLLNWDGSGNLITLTNPNDVREINEIGLDEWATLRYERSQVAEFFELLNLPGAE